MKTVDIDRVVVERILSGDWKLPANRDERIEVARRWRGSRKELLRLTGWNISRDLKAAGITLEGGAA